MHLRCLLLLLLVSPLARGETLMGQVVAVAGGDLVQVADARSGVRHPVRIAGIAAPDKYQSFGARSQQQLAAIVFGRDVLVQGGTRDRAGRVVGRVLVAAPGCHSPQCPKDIDAGLEQLRAGMAWWFKTLAGPLGADEQARYQEVEFQARLHRTGLWADRNPVPPWDWRPLR